MRRRLTLMVAILALLIVSGQGCSSEESTTVTHTTVTPAQNGPYAQGYGTMPEEGSTVTTTTTETERPDSLLGATAHAVGTAIALPFRIVGDTLGLIF